MFINDIDVSPTMGAPENEDWTAGATTPPFPSISPPRPDIRSEGLEGRGETLTGPPIQTNGPTREPYAS